MPWRDRLTFAVHLGDIKATSCLLNLGQSSNGPPELESSLLHLAVKNNDLEMCKLLIENGADLCKTDILCQTSLYECMDNDVDIEILQLLLSSGADPNSKDIFGRTPLHYAAANGHSEAMNALLEVASNSTNITDYSNSTALHFLAFVDNMEVEENAIISCIEILQTKGADPNIQDREGRTPLHILLNGNGCNLNLVKSILHLFSDIDLHVKDEKGNNIIHHLLQIPPYEDRGSFVPKVLKGEYISLPVVKRLLRDKNYEGLSPFLEYFSNPFFDKETVEKLLDIGANVNCQDNMGMTPLLASCFFHNYDVVKCLIDRGAHLTSYDIFDQGAICRARSVEMVQLLVRKGADLNTCDKRGRSVLCQIICFADSQLVSYLLENGIGVNIPDVFGSTALHHAAYCNQPELQEILLSHGADPNIIDQNGNTAAEIHDMFQKRVHLCYDQDKGDLDPETSRYTDCVVYPDDFVNKKLKQKLLTPNEITKALSHLMSKDRSDFSENCIITTTVNQLIERIAAYIGEIDSRFAVDVIKTGSMSEGTKVEYPDEFDYAFSLPVFAKSFEIVESSEANALVKLKSKVFPPASSLACFCDDQGFLICGFVRERLSNLLTRALHSKDIWCSNKLLYDGISDSSGPGELQHPITGFSVVYIGAIHKYLPINVDIAPCVLPNCPWFPSYMRKSGSHLPHDIKSNGCLLLIQPPEITEEETGYCRVSFSLMESAILKHMPKMARDAYKALKLLNSNLLCPPIKFKGDDVETKDTLIRSEDVVKSYYLKTALLHSFEENMYMNLESTGPISEEVIKLAVKTLETLKLAATKKHLPSVFLQGLNVFSYEDTYIYENTQEEILNVLEMTTKEIKAFCTVHLGMLGKY